LNLLLDPDCLRRPTEVRPDRTLEHLGWLCPHHHALKTHSGYRLTGPVGARVWRGPDGEPVANAPPDHLFDFDVAT